MLCIITNIAILNMNMIFIFGGTDLYCAAGAGLECLAVPIVPTVPGRVDAEAVYCTARQLVKRHSLSVSESEFKNPLLLQLLLSGKQMEAY